MRIVDHYESRLPALINLVRPCVAFAFVGHCFYRNSRESCRPEWVNHEHIHCYQMKEQGLVAFFRNYEKNENEARRHENDPGYISGRWPDL